jgi:hypothetical protein
MLIHLPPCLETAAHARSIGEAVVDEKGGRTQTAVSMIAIDNHLFGLIGALQEFLDVAVVQTDGPGNVRLFVRTWITPASAVLSSPFYPVHSH